MNIEDVKKKYGEGHSMPDEVRYLLSIIEQREKEIDLLKQSKADVEHNRKLLSEELHIAEKAFEEVKTATKFLQHVPPLGMLYDLAEINLKAIRK